MTKKKTSKRKVSTTNGNVRAKLVSWKTNAMVNMKRGLNQVLYHAKPPAPFTVCYFQYISTQMDSIKLSPVKGDK